MLSEIAAGFPKSDILVVTDSWFGDHGLWNPLRKCPGNSAHLTSRLRSKNNLYELPVDDIKNKFSMSRVEI